MSSLFWKIFLFFWLAMVLIGAALVILALTTDPHRAQFARNRQELQQYGRQLVAAFEKGGPPLLEEKHRDLRASTRHRLFLFRGAEGPLSGKPVPPPPRQLIPLALQSGEVQMKPGPHGLWVALPLEKDYVLLVKPRPPGRLEMLLDPHRLGPRLLITFVIAGIICYLLARSLTAPIGKLRQATRRFAGGELDTRVGDSVRGHDEIAGLAGDFDRMAERIEGLLGSQKRLLRDISHELRSPLARLNVALELALKKSGPEAKGALERIRLESERLNEMIGQLLSLNQLESRPGEIQKEAVALDTLVETIARDADFEARNRGRAVRVLKTEPAVVNGNAELLHRAIENVVRNAVHYTPEGSEVEISVASANVEGVRHALVRVRDRGPGVPEEHLADLFKPFYRVADARDRKSGGTGIGLAIAERAVRLHDGTVTAANAPDGGLVVEIRLPA